MLTMPTDKQMMSFCYSMLKQLDLRPIDWKQVAEEQNISNGHAARMRYSRFRQQMGGPPNHPRRTHRLDDTGLDYQDLSNPASRNTTLSKAVKPSTRPQVGSCQKSRSSGPAPYVRTSQFSIHQKSKAKRKTACYGDDDGDDDDDEPLMRKSSRAANVMSQAFYPQYRPYQTPRTAYDGGPFPPFAYPHVPYFSTPGPMSNPPMMAHPTPIAQSTPIGFQKQCSFNDEPASPRFHQVPGKDCGVQTKPLTPEIAIEFDQSPTLVKQEAVAESVDKVSIQPTVGSETCNMPKLDMTQSTKPTETAGPITTQIINEVAVPATAATDTVTEVPIVKTEAVVASIFASDKDAPEIKTPPRENATSRSPSHKSQRWQPYHLNRNTSAPTPPCSRICNTMPGPSQRSLSTSPQQFCRQPVPAPESAAAAAHQARSSVDCSSVLQQQHQFPFRPVPETAHYNMANVSQHLYPVSLTSPTPTPAPQRQQQSVMTIMPQQQQQQQQQPPPQNMMATGGVPFGYDFQPQPSPFYHCVGSGPQQGMSWQQHGFANLQSGGNH